MLRAVSLSSVPSGISILFSDKLLSAAFALSTFETIMGLVSVCSLRAAINAFNSLVVGISNFSAFGMLILDKALKELLTDPK